MHCFPTPKNRKEKIKGSFLANQFKIRFSQFKTTTKTNGFFSKTIPNPSSCLHLISKQQGFGNLAIQTKPQKLRKAHGIEKRVDDKPTCGETKLGKLKPQIEEDGGGPRWRTWDPLKVRAVTAAEKMMMMMKANIFLFYLMEALKPIFFFFHAAKRQNLGACLDLRLIETNNFQNKVFY